MSGILNTKQRVMDTIVTVQGRSLMALGRFDIKYVTFTDGATFYQADVLSGSADATGRIYLESCQLPQDMITFETDDAGKLMPFPNASKFNVHQGQIFYGAGSGLTFITGSDFSSQVGSMLSSSADNFQRQQQLGTIDQVFEDDEFLISDQSVVFRITDTVPISNPNAQAINVNYAESFFQDRKLSHLPNFQYLPPLTKLTDRHVDPNDPDIRQQYQLADFPAIGWRNKFSNDDLNDEMDTALQQGNSAVIRFDPTNNANSLFAQLFEVRSDSLLKLDVLDVGKFPSRTPGHPDRRMFYAGKVFLDDNGTHTFIRIFTLVFE